MLKALRQELGGGGNTYAPFGELIPNLTQLALANDNFSTTDTLGGIVQTIGTGWTIAALISYNCAIPQTQLPYKSGYNDNVARYYLHSAVCLGDVLDSLGYAQVMFQGTSADFAAARGFFTSHKIAMRDYKYFESRQMLQGDFQGMWGAKDSVIFAFAKDYLQAYTESKPFALYISTMDTHHPNGFVDTQYCQGFEKTFQNAVRCSDTIISDFVAWVQGSRFKDNTSIIILGDHKSMKQNFFPPDTKRSIYNAFINTHFPKEKLKNRLISHFDITPLFLESLGISIERFGLGRNPLYSQTLLESLGEQSLAQGLRAPSRIYEGFWNLDKTKLKESK